MLSPSLLFPWSCPTLQGRWPSGAPREPRLLQSTLALISTETVTLCHSGAQVLKRFLCFTLVLLGTSSSPCKMSGFPARKTMREGHTGRDPKTSWRDRQRPSCLSHVQPTTNLPADQIHANDHGPWTRQTAGPPSRARPSPHSENKQNGYLKRRLLRWLIPQQLVMETNGNSSFYSCRGSGQNPRIIPTPLSHMLCIRTIRNQDI